MFWDKNALKLMYRDGFPKKYCKYKRIKLCQLRDENNYIKTRVTTATCY